MLSWIHKRILLVRAHEGAWAFTLSFAAHGVLVCMLVFLSWHKSPLYIAIYAKKRGNGDAPIVFSPTRRGRLPVHKNGAVSKPVSAQRKQKKREVQKKKAHSTYRRSAPKKQQRGKKKRVSAPPVPEEDPNMIVIEESPRPVVKEKQLQLPQPLPVAEPVAVNTPALSESSQEMSAVPADEVFVEGEGYSETESGIVRRLQEALVDSFVGIPGVEVEQKITCTIVFSPGKEPVITYTELSGIPAFDIRLKSFIKAQVAALQSEYGSYDKSISVALFIS